MIAYVYLFSLYCLMRFGTIVYLLLFVISFLFSFIFIESGDVMGYIVRDAENNIISISPWAQAICTAIKYLCYFLIFFFIVRLDKDMKQKGALLYELKISKRIKLFDVFTIIILGAVCICAFLLVQTATIDIFGLFGWSDSATEIKISNWGQYFAFVFALALLPAIVEELIFRGLILKSLMKYGAAKAVIISALLFLFFHMNPGQTVYQFMLGIVLALVTVYSGNLVLAMILHFVNNFIVVTYTFLAQESQVLITWNAGTIATTIFLAVIGTAIIYRLLLLLKRPEVKWKFGTKRFVEKDNLGYIGCVIVGLFLWVMMFIA